MTTRGTGTETLSARLTIKALDQDGQFEGYASVFDDLDSVRDRVARGAFAKSLREKGPERIKLLWQHNPGEPVGTWLEMKEDSRGLFVRGQLLTTIQRGRDAYELLKAKIVDALSIGFRTIKSEDDEETGERTLLEIDLWEVSLVTFPALDSARISNVKAITPFGDLPLGDPGKVFQRSRAEQRVRRWSGGIESGEANPKYRRAFVWYDREDAKSFDAHKLLIADVVDNELRAIPRGIVSAATALVSARGDDIPEGDRPAAMRHLDRYFAKMAEEFTDPEIAAPWDEDRSADSFKLALAGARGLIETERDFERFLRDAGFTQTEATGIVAGQAFKAISPPRDSDGSVDEAVAALRRAAKLMSPTEG